MSKKQDISQLPVKEIKTWGWKTWLVIISLGLCVVCGIVSRFSGRNETPPTAVVEVEQEDTPTPELPTPTPEQEDTPTPQSTATKIATPPPTDTPLPELSFSDVIQHPDEKGWSITQFTTYQETIVGGRVDNWSGTILEVDEFAGEPYISLDMEPGEPVIDAYVYIKEEDILKVGLGQAIIFAGTIDSTWPEDNGFYALQIKDTTLQELGEIPKPVTPTPEETPIVAQAGDVPLDVALYASQISEPVNALATALTSLGILLQNPDLGDTEWTIQVATQVTIIRLAHEKLTLITPPAEMEDTHTLILEATSDCNESMDYLVSGIDNLNADNMNTAAQLMLQCGEKMKEPSRLMVEYQSGATPEEAEVTTTDTPEPTVVAVVPTAIPVPPTDTPAPLPPPAQLPKDNALGVQKQVGDWGMKLYDVKKAKAVYHFGEADIAQGVYLMPFIEFTNMASGTKSPIEDLNLFIVDSSGNTYELGFSDGDLGAAHQFQAGHIYDDIDPGVLLGVVIPADVPENTTDTWLKAEQDPDFVMYLGDASTLPVE